jgi:hypothetical protein
MNTEVLWSRSLTDDTLISVAAEVYDAYHTSFQPCLGNYFCMYCLGSSGEMEERDSNGSYEVVVEKSVGAEEDLPEKLSGLETNESVVLNGQE